MATNPEYAAMADALAWGLGALDAAAAGGTAPAVTAAVIPVGGGDDDILGGVVDDGGEIDDAILEDDGRTVDEVVLLANEEIEAMDDSTPAVVPAATLAPPVGVPAPVVRPKETAAGRAQWHAQAGPRADRGAS